MKWLSQRGCVILRDTATFSPGKVVLILPLAAVSETLPLTTSRLQWPFQWGIIQIFLLFIHVGLLGQGEWLFSSWRL